MTLLGTPEYLAPEGFLGEGQDARSDLWSLGASLYVMLLASHPFGGRDPQELYQRVLGEPIFFPSNHFTFAECTRSLIRACMSLDATMRPTASTLWAMDFFALPLPPTASVPALSKEDMLKKAVAPPWVPLCKDAYDTRYFVEADDSDDDADEVALDQAGVASAGSGGRMARLRYIAVEHPGGETSSGTLASPPPRTVPTPDLADAAKWLNRYSQRSCNVDDLLTT